jgi:hypothetical protein
MKRMGSETLQIPIGPETLDVRENFKTLTKTEYTKMKTSAGTKHRRQSFDVPPVNIQTILEHLKKGERKK